jgi:hypothetical protein
VSERKRGNTATIKEALKVADQVEILFSCEFSSFVHTELQALVQPFCVGICYVYKETDAFAPGLTSPLAHGFDQLPANSSSLAIAIHANGIQIKLVRFGFSWDFILGTARSLLGGSFQRFIQLPGDRSIIADGDTDYAPIPCVRVRILNDQRVLVANTITFLLKEPFENRHGLGQNLGSGQNESDRSDRFKDQG